MKCLLTTFALVVMVFLVMPFTAEAASETESNDSRSTANTISVNTVVDGCLSVSGDKDYYKFTTKEAGYVVLKFGKEFDSDEYNGWKVALMNSSGTTIKTGTFYAGNTETEAFCRIGLPAGNYYVCVSNGSYRSNATYHLNVNYKASDVWESEFNDSKSTADPINVNRTYYGTLQESGDKDYYKFTLPRAGKVELKFGKKFDSDEYNSWKVTLMNKNGTTIKSGAFYAGNEETESFCPVGLPAGTYYVSVTRGSYRSVAVYNLKLNYKASSVWETEFNDSASTADEIAANKVYYGTLAFSGDEDYYKVKLTTAATVSIRFSEDFKDRDEYNSWRIELLDSNRKTLQSFRYYCGTDQAETCTPQNLPAGTYYVKVRSGSYRSTDVYNFKVNAKFTSTTSKVTKLTNTAGGIKVEWNKTSGVSGYKIYRKKGSGSYTLIKTVKGNSTFSYKDTAVKSDNLTTYTYLVKAYKGNLESTSCTSGTICRQIKMPAPGVSNQSGLKMKVTWSKNSGYSGYQIKYVAGSTSKTVKVAGGTNSSKTITGLKKGATYKVYIRSYKTIGKKTYYSAWSSARTVKINK